MKVKKPHYDYMKHQIGHIWSQEKHENHTEFVRNEGRSKDVAKRVRWDWSYYAGLTPWICSYLYSYCDDTHIDTALRQIMRELTQENSR
jgi:hypothetical protein